MNSLLLSFPYPYFVCWEFSFKICSLFFNWVVSLTLCLLSFLYIVGITPLSVVFLTIIRSHVVDFFFTWLWSLAIEKLFSFMKSQLSIMGFTPFTNVLFRKSFPTPLSFRVLCIFRSLDVTYFEISSLFASHGMRILLDVWPESEVLQSPSQSINTLNTSHTKLSFL